MTRGCIAAESATRLPLEAVVAPNKLNRWQRALKPALQKSKSGVHPWHEFEIHKRPTELVTRWDYDAAKDSWETSETLVKMEDVSFARGAMRECYRMKKMSQVGTTPPLTLVITRRHIAPSPHHHRYSPRPRSISSSHLHARLPIQQAHSATHLSLAGQRAFLLHDGLEGLQQLRRQALHRARDATRHVLQRHKDAGSRQ